MTKLTWKETVKLGKVEVKRRLEELNLKFIGKIHYMKLCSMLYQHMKTVTTNVVSLCTAKVDKIYSSDLEPIEKIVMGYDSVISYIDNVMAQYS